MNGESSFSKRMLAVLHAQTPNTLFNAESHVHVGLR